MALDTQSQELSPLFAGKIIDYVEELYAGEQDGRSVRGQLKLVFKDSTNLLITASVSEHDIESPLLDLQVQL